MSYSKEPNSPSSEEIDLVSVLQALADPVRLGIVQQLARSENGRELACGQIEVPVTKATCSHHIKTLVSAGVVSYRNEGTHKYLSIRRCELDQRFPGLMQSLMTEGSTVGSIPTVL